MYSAKLNQTSRKPKNSIYWLWKVVFTVSSSTTDRENYFSQPVDWIFWFSTSLINLKRTIKVRIVLKSYVPSQDSLENLSMGLEPIHFSRFDLFITRLACGSPSNEKILTWKVKRLLAHWKIFKAVPGMKNTTLVFSDVYLFKKITLHHMHSSTDFEIDLCIFFHLLK